MDAHTLGNCIRHLTLMLSIKPPLFTDELSPPSRRVAYTELLGSAEDVLKSPTHGNALDTLASKNGVVVSIAGER